MSQLDLPPRHHTLSVKLAAQKRRFFECPNNTHWFRFCSEWSFCFRFPPLPSCLRERPILLRVDILPARIRRQDSRAAIGPNLEDCCHRRRLLPWGTMLFEVRAQFPRAFLVSSSFPLTLFLPWAGESQIRNNLPSNSSMPLVDNRVTPPSAGVSAHLVSRHWLDLAIYVRCRRVP
jgi:hypothetical protein